MTFDPFADNLANFRERLKWVEIGHPTMEKVLSFVHSRVTAFRSYPAVGAVANMVG